jgi:hypothetical protein
MDNGTRCFRILEDMMQRGRGFYIHFFTSRDFCYSIHDAIRHGSGRLDG